MYIITCIGYLIKHSLVIVLVMVHSLNNTPPPFPPQINKPLTDLRSCTLCTVEYFKTSLKFQKHLPSCNLLRLTEVCMGLAPRPCLTGLSRDGVELAASFLGHPSAPSLASLRFGVEVGVFQATWEFSSSFNTIKGEKQLGQLTQSIHVRVCISCFKYSLV